MPELAARRRSAFASGGHGGFLEANVAVEKIVLSVRGMHCASCAQRVTRALALVPGVVAAKVDLIGRRAVVDCVPGATNPQALKDALQGLGYQVHA